jgi:hypothetical protein
MLPHIPQSVPVIAITAHAHPSSCPLLSFNSPDKTILLPAPLHIDEETSFGLSAPTSSTTVALALGDALALATAENLHILPGQGPSEIFKGYHPGGAIGAAVARDTAAASAISTPATSMTTSPSLASLEDALPIKLTFDEDDDNIRETSKTELDSVCTSDHFVPVECIPTVIPSSPQSSESKESTDPQILDLVLTAIQSPASKSWVKLSETQIVPPALLRYMSSQAQPQQTIDTTAKAYILTTPLSTIQSPTSVHSSKWLRVRASSSLDELRCMLFSSSSPSSSAPSDEDRALGDKKYLVISVMDDIDLDKVVGFICGDDIV